MRSEYGEWPRRKKVYIDCKTIPGILNNNNDIINLIKGVQQVFAPWDVGIISCDTEADPRDIQRIRILGSAKGYPLIGPSVVEIAYTGETIQPMGEFSHPRPFSVFCNRIPASMRSLAGLIQVCVHAIGHGFGLEHNTDTTSWMFPSVAPRVKHFTDLERQFLNITAASRTPSLTAVDALASALQLKNNWGSLCECSFVE